MSAGGVGLNNITTDYSAYKQDYQTSSFTKEMQDENNRMMKESMAITKFNNQNSINKMQMDAMSQQANGMVDSFSKASSNLAQKAKIDQA